jgi:hypothetical protein
MWPLAGLALGTVIGAVGAALRGSEIAQHTRPLAKALLKATIAAVHDAQVWQAQIVEAAEDLYAEANAEVAADRRASVSAAAEAKAQEIAEALHEAQIRQAEVVAAVKDLYAETKGEVTAERLASVIAAAEARAREAIETARGVRPERPSAEAVIDLTSIKRSHGSGSSDG